MIMKKIIAVIAIVFLGTTAFAQVKLGLKLTPNFSWSQIIYTNGDTTLGISEINSNGIKLRGGAGVIVDLNLSDNFAFATGVEYMTKGAGFKMKMSDSTNTETAVTYSLQYLQIPIGIKVFTNEIMDYTKIYFQVGITQNVNIGAKVNKEKTYVDPENSASNLSYQKNISLLETSLAVGVGIEMEMGESTAVVAGISYNRGFTNIDATDTFESPNKLANGYLGIDIGLKF